MGVAPIARPNLPSAESLCDDAVPRMNDLEELSQSPGEPATPGGSAGGARGLSAAALEVAAALQSLSRAARSFSLYDARNEAVKRLIADYRDKTVGLLRRAPFTLDIYPFDINLGAESVYKEPERERSLAFRLFRDGARRLRFEAGLEWSDVISLLEVLSVRSTGVRQQEEDLITLLRKADFKRIKLEAVEGYVPDEEHPEPDAKPKAVARRAEDEPPEDWDLPLKRPGAGGKLEPREVDPATLAALRSEEGPDAMPDQALRAVAELLELGEDREQLVPFVEEVQEYFFVERKLDHLAKLAQLYAAAFAGDGSGTRRTLPMLADDKAFERLLRALPDGTADVPPSFLAMVDALAGDTLGRALELLASGAEGSRRAALCAIVERAGRAHAELLVERLPAAAPPLARELFAILGRIAPERCLDAAFALAEHPDAAFQLELVDVIGRAPANVRLARGLQQLLSSAHEEVRVRAAERLVERGGARAVTPIAAHVTQSAATLSASEATALGRALARASAEDALPYFVEWAGHGSGLRGLLSRFAKQTPTQRMLAWVAVSGLELIAGAEADRLLVEVLGRARDELERHTLEVLARRAGGAKS